MFKKYAERVREAMPRNKRKSPFQFAMFFVLLLYAVLFQLGISLDEEMPASVKILSGAILGPWTRFHAKEWYRALKGNSYPRYQVPHADPKPGYLENKDPGSKK